MDTFQSVLDNILKAVAGSSDDELGQSLILFSKKIREDFQKLALSNEQLVNITMFTVLVEEMTKRYIASLKKESMGLKDAIDTIEVILARQVANTPVGERN